MSEYQAVLNEMGELLDLANVKVTGLERQGSEVIRLRVVSASEAGMCPGCGKPSVKVHDVGEEQMIRDLSIWGKFCWLKYRPRRFECEVCERTFVERVAWKAAELNYTQRYEAHVYERCRRESMKDVAGDERLSEDIVTSIFERWAKKTLSNAAIQV
jgi:transposase